MGSVCGTENQEASPLPPPVAVDDGQPRILPPVTVAKKDSSRGSFLKKESFLYKDDDAVDAPVFQGHEGTPAVSKGKVLAEYVWLGGSKTTGGFDIRQKTRTLESKPEKPEDLPVWNFDGSSTGQAPGDDSEVLLQPVAVFDDPFRGGEHVLVMCECLSPGMEAIPTNTRRAAKAIFEEKLDEQPWFGIEQEYTFFEKDTRTPLGWPGATRADRSPAAPQHDRLGRREARDYRDKPAAREPLRGAAGGFPGPQGPYYCSAGTDVAFGRLPMEAHYQACLYAGISISGTNAEVMPGQWEYQIGPCEGIASGDHLWMSRYLLIRVCEALGINVSFDPKPIPGDWNGAGCHTNYSTAKMRAEGGYKEIISAIEKLGKKHQEHIRAYGEGNHRRLTGAHETAPIDKFSYGVANRGASIRIPRAAEADLASNMDPYVVTSKIFQTTCID